MMKFLRAVPVISAVAAALLVIPGVAPAADQDRVQAQEQEQEHVFGSQLMTEQERSEHRARMRAAATLEQREQIRSEHHERMVERAKSQGVTLPDAPPAGGGGMGPGGGMGYGRNR